MFSWSASGPGGEGRVGIIPEGPPVALRDTVSMIPGFVEAWSISEMESAGEYLTVSTYCGPYLVLFVMMMSLSSSRRHHS